MLLGEESSGRCTGAGEIPVEGLDGRNGQFSTRRAHAREILLHTQDAATIAEWNHFVLGWPFADRTNFALLKIKP